MSHFLRHLKSHKLKTIKQKPLLKATTLLVIMVGLFLSFSQRASTQMVTTLTSLVSAPSANVYLYSEIIDATGVIVPSCAPITINAFSYIPFNASWYVSNSLPGNTSIGYIRPNPFAPSLFVPFGSSLGAILFYDSACTTSPVPASVVSAYYKTVNCSPSQVVTGVQDYQFPEQVDDEHVDGYCTVTSGLTFGSPYWVVSPGAMNTINYATKDAVCSPGDVMVGLRMFGASNYVDDEHVDAYCATLTGATIDVTSQYWVSAPNAMIKLWGGGTKSALCNLGDVAIGVRWYETNPYVDNDHTDVLCAPLKVIVPPTVNLNFL